MFEEAKYSCKSMDIYVSGTGTNFGIALVLESQVTVVRYMLSLKTYLTTVIHTLWPAPSTHYLMLQQTWGCKHELRGGI